MAVIVNIMLILSLTLHCTGGPYGCMRLIKYFSKCSLLILDSKQCTKKGEHYCEFTIPQHISHTCNYYYYWEVNGYYWEVNGYSYHHWRLELTSLKAIHETTSLCEIKRSVYGGFMIVVFHHCTQGQQGLVSMHAGTNC